MLQVICRPEATNKEEAYTFHTVHRKTFSDHLKKHKADCVVSNLVSARVARGSAP